MTLPKSIENNAGLLAELTQFLYLISYHIGSGNHYDAKQLAEHLTAELDLPDSQRDALMQVASDLKEIYNRTLR